MPITSDQNCASYDKALIYMPADTYAKVDIRFKNRVFATRKNITNTL